MKNLDLNGLGVQEMNAEEMNGVNGGFILAAACVTLAVLYLAGTCCGLAQGRYIPDGR
ncbi:MAG: class IIb bacteriocin, lactobin A/cerein 7B family [Paludibacter sp.]|nr:class IIb bacteriocin, lactobin A/cerein 7B family [Paludibacter sp.]